MSGIDLTVKALTAALLTVAIGAFAVLGLGWVPAMPLFAASAGLAGFLAVLAVPRIGGGKTRPAEVRGETVTAGRAGAAEIETGAV